MAESWADYFEDGETLLWEGAPRRRTRPTLPMIGLAIFGAPFLMAGLGSSLAGLALMLGMNIDWELAGGLIAFLFGLPFLGAGAGMMFGPYYLASQAHRHVRYALTNRRAYIASRWWHRKMEVLTIASDAPVTVEGDRSVYFHTIIGTDSDGDRSTERKGFENISDAFDVYHMVRKIQANAT